LLTYGLTYSGPETKRAEVSQELSTTTLAYVARIGAFALSKVKGHCSSEI
jgi:hypothetical protein